MSMEAPKRPSLLEPTRFEQMMEVAERNDRMTREGREPSPEQRLESLHAQRNYLHEMLVDLEQMRKRREAVAPEQFETLSFMMREGYLHGRGKEDALSVLEAEDSMRDEALTGIALLETVHESIAEAESHAGFTEDELEQRAAVRAKHLNMLRAEWGIN